MGIFAGPSAAFRGVGLLFAHPSLILLALIPAVAGFGISYLGVHLAEVYGAELINAIWAEPEGWFAHFFWSIFNWFMGLSTTLLAIIITPFLVMLIGFPLCDPLMSKAYTLLGGEAVKSDFAAEMRRTIQGTLGILVIGLVGAVVLALLGLIPPLGVVTVPFATFVWTPFFLAWDSMDPTLGRKQLEFKQKLGVVRGNFWRSWGQGLTTMFLVAVPFVNFIGLPIAALAGVHIVRDLEVEGKLPAPAIG